MPPEVILITTDNCFGCNLLKKMFTRDSIPYREVPANTREGKELIRTLEARTVPTGILPDGTVIHGFQPAKYTKFYGNRPKVH